MHSLFQRLNWLVLAWTLLATLPPAARAAESVALDIRRVEIGYGGTYKSGYVTPIWLTLRSGRDMEGVVEVLAADGDGVPVAFAASAGTSLPTKFQAGEDTLLRIYVKIGPEKSVLSVRLRSPETGQVLWRARFPNSTPRPVASSSELVVALGQLPTLAEATTLVPRSNDRLVTGAFVAEANRVPEDWWGWEGVDTIVVPLGADNLAERLSSRQWNGLQQWVEVGGGRLVVCVGERGRDVLIGNHPLVDLIPAKLVDMIPLRDLARLHELTGHSLAANSTETRPHLAQLADTRGRIELTVTGQREELPLLVRASRGFGEVVLLTLDPDGPALAGWPGRARLLSPALAEQSRNFAADKVPRRSSRLGYDDLSGQLRIALDSFSQVHVVNLTTVAILTLAYLALIGPIEFLILRRLKLPSAITWCSFPMLAAVFCVIGWYAARAAHGGNPMVRQCEVIDVDAQRQLVRGTTWLHLYSPQTTTYRLSLSCEGELIGLDGPPVGWVSWQGLPGQGLGGLSANQLATPTMLPYDHRLASAELSLSDVPVPLAGSKAFSARWWGTTSLAPVTPLAISQFGLLEGEVVNPLPVELRDCLLVYDEWMYRLKTLSPGQRVRVADLDMLNLEARLQQRTVANAKDIISPWEPDATDVPRIVQMMMFHQSARGSSYTNLAHHYQGYLDLTPRIRNDRAVLVGRMSQSITTASLPGKENLCEEGNSWSWVRIVLPISPGQPQ